MDSRPPSAPRAAEIATRLVALWLLTGALFKLLVGTPNDLPQVVRDLPLELGLTYNLAIAIELAVGLCALVRPRWAWPFLAGALVTFDAVLVTQIIGGAESCGCFGSKVSIPPWVMLAIDSALLAFLLGSRPWSRLSRGAPAPAAVLLAAIGLAVPWFWDRQVTVGVEADGAPVEGAWVELDIENWIGQDIFDTPLAKPPLSDWIDVNSLFLDGLWVFWRATCDHCARHLEFLADTETGDRLITLIRLEEPHDTEGNRVVHRMPVGNFVMHASLPPSISYVITTPGELLLEGGRIVAAKEGAEPEDHLSR